MIDENDNNKNDDNDNTTNEFNVIPIAFQVGGRKKIYSLTNFLRIPNQLMRFNRSW